MKIANIAKNTSYFTLALILQKVISFSYFIIIARAIGPENLGKYYFAISFTTIFAIFIDVGMASVLIRETAKVRQRAEYYLRNVIGLKLILTLFSFVTVFVLINLMGYPELTKQLVYLSSVAMILDSFTLTFFAVSRGFHNLSFESFAVVLYQALILSMGSLFLYFDYSLHWLMGAIVVASAINFLYSASIVKYQWKMSLWPQFNQDIIRNIIKMSLPFALFGIFQRFYTYFDSILLSILAGDTYVGLYSVAFKITFALQFLPLAFVASLFPAMSSYYVHNKKQLATIFERAMNYLIIIALPISFGIIVLADRIVLIFKEGYTGSILPLQIIVASLIFIFASYPVGSLLNACDRQRTNTANMGIVLVFSVLLNIFLIPRYQAIGASITVLITNALLLILGLFWVPKIIEYHKKVIITVFAKALLSVLIMGLVIWLIKVYIPIIASVFVGAVVYIGVLYILKGYTKEDIISIRNAIIGKA
ncbi:MAG: flippase [Candidatus Falkowbacteria bacterium]